MVNKKLLLVAGFLTSLLLCYPSYARAEFTLQTKVTGVENHSIKRNIDNALAAQTRDLKELTRDDIDSIYQDAPQIIKRAIEPFGYFNPQIKSQLTADDDKFSTNFKIDLGAATHVNKINLKILGDGKNNQALQRLITNFPIKKGDILNTKIYQKAKQNLLHAATNHGYIKAKFIETQIAVDRANHIANITITMQTGPRFKFGKIVFSKTYFSDSFLQRFVPFKSETFYSEDDLQKLQDNLTNSNYFNQVTVEPQISKARNSAIPLLVHLKTKSSRQYTVGAGYGTDTGPRGLLGMELRNLTSNGQYAKGFIRGSQKESNAELHYFVPGHNPVTDRYDLSVAASIENQDYGDSRTINTSLGYMTTIFSDWQQTARLSLQQEYDKPTGADHFSSKLFLIPSINWLKSVTNHPIRVTRGWKVNLHLQGATRSLGSKTDFAQIRIDGKIIEPFFDEDILAIVRGTYAATALHEFDELPLSLQYYTGGARTVRGYRYDSIGPGRNMAVVSLELRKRIHRHIYFSAFIDAGDISNSFNLNLKKGIGGGIVWLSPVGTLELTVAEGVDAPGHPKLIQFSMGPEF